MREHQLAWGVVCLSGLEMEQVRLCASDRLEPSDSLCTPPGQHNKMLSLKSKQANQQIGSYNPVEGIVK